MFNDFQLSQAQILLHKNRKNVLAEIDDLNIELEELGALERGEFVSLEFENDLRSRQVADFKAVIQEIDLATKRIADKTWGFCLKCLERMTKEELAAALYRKHCDACESADINQH